MNALLKELHAYHHEVATKITQIKELLERIRHGSAGADDRKLLFKQLEALHGDAERHHHENEELIRLALLATEARSTNGSWLSSKIIKPSSELLDNSRCWSSQRRKRE